MKVRFLMLAAIAALQLTPVRAHAEYNHNAGLGAPNANGIPMGPAGVEILGDEVVSDPITRAGKNFGGPEKKNPKKSTTITLRTQRYIIVPTLTTQVVPVSVLVANDGGSKGGKSAYWDAYFSGNNKVKALADAIDGIGPATAEKIVRDGRFFRSKPRSWDEFVNEIYRADKALKLGIAKNVTDTNKMVNAQRLGYDLTQYHFEVRNEEREVVVPVKTPIGEPISKNFNVVADGKLLAGENEQVVVRWNGKEYSAQVVGNANNYAVSYKENQGTGDVTVNLTASRNHVGPTSDGVTTTTFIKNGTIHARVTNPNFDADDTGKQIVEIEGRVNGFAGSSQVGKKAFYMNARTQEIDTGLSAKSGKKYFTKIWTRAENSDFFSDDKSWPKESDYTPYVK